MISPSQRFWNKVAAVGNVCECWIWTAYINDSGYGRFGLNGGLVYAHRFIYEETIGPIPPGLELDHLCTVRECVNPYHLEPVTHLENVRRSEAGKQFSDRTHCPSGHEYTPENTRINTAGSRVCRTCRRKGGRICRQ